MTLQTDKMIQYFIENRPVHEFLRPEDINRIIDPNHFFTPLHLAVIYTENVNTFINMLTNGARISIQDRSGNTALDLAMRYNRTSLWNAIQSIRATDENKRLRIEDANRELLNKNRSLEHLGHQLQDHIFISQSELSCGSINDDCRKRKRVD